MASREKNVSSIKINAVEGHVRARRFIGAAEGERATETLRLKEHGRTHSEAGLQAPVTEQSPL
jgi:hypothetical protein